MFGYIKPLEPQLKVCELESYKAVYCGVCRGLSKRFGPAARCTLSYDFTFIAMLHAAINDSAPVFTPQRCPLNPFKKRPHLDYCDSVEFSCEMAILMLREKCADNVADSSFLPYLGWSILTPVIENISSDVEKKHPDASRIAREMTEAQKKAEALGSEAKIDICCDPTASALGDIYSLMSKDKTTKRILKRMGYMLGRYMYLCDAIDDFDDDVKKNQFNPLSNYPDDSEFDAVLRFTAAEAANAYALLDIKYFKEILDNIMFMGLDATAHSLIERRKKRHEKSI
ncbi:MAG: hypothetical protein II995_02840 [Oscillospiraceae bacterium]|nr:hypothetical protein [Oscillospiraceae bacterium]